MKAIVMMGLGGLLIFRLLKVVLCVGNGFVRVVSNFLNAFYPERNIRVTNMGKMDLCLTLQSVKGIIFEGSIVNDRNIIQASAYEKNRI